MCDYSLEMYASRPAVAGESLTTARFPTGSIGMVGDRTDCAVCIQPGTVLAITLPPELLARHKIDDGMTATFAKLDTGCYRDGLRFENGVELSLQQIPAGCAVAIAATPVIPAAVPAQATA